MLTRSSTHHLPVCLSAYFVAEMRMQCNYGVIYTYICLPRFAIEYIYIYAWCENSQQKKLGE